MDNPKPANQLTYALENRIPLMIWLGEDEISKGVVKLKVSSRKADNGDEGTNRSEG